MKQEQKVALKTMAIKAKFANAVHQLRADRGYVSKNKTTLQEYLAKQEAGLFLKGNVPTIPQVVLV